MLSKNTMAPLPVPGVTVRLGAVPVDDTVDVAVTPKAGTFHSCPQTEYATDPVVVTVTDLAAPVDDEHTHHSTSLAIPS